MKMLILANPSSHGGRAAKRLPEYARMLPQADIVVLRNGAEASARAAAAAGYDAVVAYGGDGTIGAVADGVMKNPDKSLKLGVLYAGTSPDFCTFHRIPTAARPAVEMLTRETAVPVEVFEIEHDGTAGHFCCSCNLGMGAEVAKRANRLRPLIGDKAGTFCALAAEIMKAKKFDLTVNGVRIEGCNHLLITRMPYIASGLKVALPDLGPGEYAIWHVRNLSPCGWLEILPDFYRGTPAGTVTVHSGVTEISADTDTAIEYDGDPHGRLPARIKLSKRKLNLICGA